MSEYTPNLHLFKYNPNTDGKEVFSLTRALNDNWDTIDNMDLLPDQTEKNGYVLTTNGSEASWGETAEVQCVVETYQNGLSWYRVWSDGWCEQGGRAELKETSTTIITLLKAYSDTNYSVSAVSITASTASDTEVGLQCTPVSINQISLTAHYLNPNNQMACWHVCGYISED